MFLSLSKSQRAIVVAVGLSLGFTLMGVWVRMMEGSFESFQQSYLRILLAGLLALIIFRKRLSKQLFRSLDRREWAIYATRAAVAYVGGVSIFTIAVQHADLSVVSFITAVPMLGLLAFIMFREKLPLLSVPFLVLSMVGVAFLTGIDITKFHFGIGEIAAIVAAVGFNIGYLMSRLHKKERNNYDNTTVLLLLGWIPVFIISLVLQEPLPSQVSLTAWVGLAFSVIFNVIGLYATNYVFTNLKAYVAGNILLLEGVWAIIIGLLLYAEPLTLAIAVGGLLIVASAIAINKIDNRNEEAQAAILDEPTK